MTHIENPEAILEAAKKYAEASAEVQRAQTHLTKDYSDRPRYDRLNDARMEAIFARDLLLLTVIQCTKAPK